MRLSPRIAFLAALLLWLPGAAQAVVVGPVQIVGLDEEMTNNVRLSLSLVESAGRDVSGRRLGYLMRVAERETREALEPFGFYSPQIEVERSRSDGSVSVTVRVDPGEPVRVRNSDIAIIGPGAEDRYLQAALDAFIPSPGAIFNQPDYEASKVRISRRLSERGYFNADFASRRVEVTRAQYAADIDLVWNSGIRYDMGPTIFEQTRPIIRQSLLEKLVYWQEGDYYHQGRIDRLRTSLSRLDYYSDIEITPEPDKAVNGRVPVTVRLTPAKRTIRTAGLSYGTDTGAGVRLGVERRYVNTRGHKALARLDYAQKRKTLTLQYRIPAFAWRDGWYTISAQGYDEQTDYIDTRRIELVASRSGQYSPQVNLLAAVHVLRERWAYAFEDDDPDAALQYRYASLFYPAVRADYVNVDDRSFPTGGVAGWLILRGGLDSAGSSADFAQLHARASTYKGLGERSRLILRGEAGHTFTNALVDLPPSLRFYAGGDSSIRGYEWREVGPRLVRYEDEDGVLRETGYLALGARNVVTASVELERYFFGNWGVAVFVDSGSAFNGTTPDWHTGVGIGARYRSPVGPIKLDVARGLDDPDSPFTISLGIGAEF